MKVILFTDDDELMQLEGDVAGVFVEWCQDDGELEEQFEDEEYTLLFIDMDYDKKIGDRILKEWDGKPFIKTIVTSSSWTAKDFRKHQRGKNPADGYIKKPIDTNLLAELIAEYAAHDETGGAVSVGGGAGESTGTKTKNPEDLTFIAVVDPTLISDAQTSPGLDVGGGGDEAKTETDMMASDSGSGNTFDPEALKEQLADVDVEDENVEAFEAQEFGMGEEVKEVLKSHAVNMDAEPTFMDDPTNKMIQAKFDLIFPDEEIPEESEDKPFAPLSDDQQAELNSVVDPVESIDLDFGDDEEISSMDEEALPQAEAEPAAVVMEESEEVIEEEIIEEIEPDSESDSDPIPETIEEVAMSENDDNQNDDISFDLDGGDDLAPLEDSVPEEISDNAASDGDAGGDLPDLGDESLVFDAAELSSEMNALKEGDDSGDEGGGDLDLGGDDAAGDLDLGGDDAGGDLDLGGDDGGLDLGGEDEEDDEGKTTVLEGGVDLGDGGDDEFQLEGSSGDDMSSDAGVGDGGLDLGDGGDDDFQLEGSTGEEAGGDLDLGDDEEIEAPGEDDLSFDAEDAGGAPEETMTSTEDVEVGGDDDDHQEFDYKTGMTTISAADDETGGDLGDDLGFDVDAGDDDIGDGTDPTMVLGQDQLAEELAGGGAEAAAPEADPLADDEFDVGDDILDDSATASEPVPTQTMTEEPVDLGSTDVVPMARLNEGELIKLQATIRHLREERDGFLKEIDKLKDEKRELQQSNTSLRAELDDAKIEISILKKRHQKEVENISYQKNLAEDKKDIYEEKAKTFKKELDRMGSKVKSDFNKIRKREKELESKLELQSIDHDNQIKSRDAKILELKRKIDSLEFNMENASIRELKSREDKERLEDRLHKIMKTLRGSLKLLEDDLELDSEILDKLNKL